MADVATRVGKTCTHTYVIRDRYLRLAMTVESKLRFIHSSSSVKVYTIPTILYNVRIVNFENLLYKNCQNVENFTINEIE